MIVEGWGGGGAQPIVVFVEVIVQVGVDGIMAF